MSNSISIINYRRIENFKKLKEEKEAYENSKMQYESYSKHVHPMIVKKAETALRRATWPREKQQ